MPQIFIHLLRWEKRQKAILLIALVTLHVKEFSHQDSLNCRSHTPSEMFAVCLWHSQWNWNFNQSYPSYVLLLVLPLPFLALPFAFPVTTLIELGISKMRFPSLLLTNVFLANIACSGITLRKYCAAFLYELT